MSGRCRAAIGVPSRSVGVLNHITLLPLMMLGPEAGKPGENPVFPDGTCPWNASPMVRNVSNCW
jgi:hypothetical protein